MIDVKKLADIYTQEFKAVGELSAHEVALLHVYDFGYGEGMTRTKPSNPIPEDVLKAAANAVEALDWSVDEPGFIPTTANVVDAIAPLIIEWARKDQAEKDAQIVENVTTKSLVAAAALDRASAAIRAQFPTPETAGAAR